MEGSQGTEDKVEEGVKEKPEGGAESEKKAEEEVEAEKKAEEEMLPEENSLELMARLTKLIYNYQGLDHDR